MVEGEGFEPSKAEPSDLQSDPFDRSGTPPQIFKVLGQFLYWSRQQELNLRPTDYKSVALPTELCRPTRYKTKTLSFNDLGPTCRVF